MTTDSRKQNHASLQRVYVRKKETMDTKQAAHEGFEQQHAVVIGGSMAGLLAARVLSTHFGQVTVIERDPLPDGAVPCTGVPQG
jgi:heterodisulfide reductase subunit A-like polyferredoxin